MADISANQYHLYRYQISDIILSSSGWKSPLTISNSLISNLTIVNPYGTTIIPEISIDCEVDYNTYYEILAKKDITATFDIGRSDIGFASNESEKSYNSNIIGSRWVSCNLKVNDKGFLHTDDVSESDLDLSDSANRDRTKRIKLLLYDYDSLIKYRKSMSAILSGSINDLIYYLLSSRSFNNFIVSPATSSFSEFAIPFGNLGENLEALNNNYGIYDFKYMVFLGLDRNYLLNYNNVGHDVEINELSTVNVLIDKGDAVEDYRGSYENSNSFFIKTKTAKISNDDYMLDFAEGGKIITSIFGEGKTVESNIGYYPVEKTFLLNSEKMANQIANKIESSKRNLSMSFSNIDLRHITPNKLYKVTADRKYFHPDYDISGDYYLASSAFVLTNTGNGLFSSATTINLCKK